MDESALQAFGGRGLLTASPLINKADLHRTIVAKGKGQVHYDPVMHLLVMQVGRYAVMTQSYDVLWHITVSVGHSSVAFLTCTQTHIYYI